MNFTFLRNKILDSSTKVDVIPQWPSVLWFTGLSTCVTLFQSFDKRHRSNSRIQLIGKSRHASEAGLKVSELHDVHVVCFLEAVTPWCSTETISYSIEINFWYYYCPFEILQAYVKRQFFTGAARPFPSTSNNNRGARVVSMKEASMDFNIFRPHKWGRKIMICDAFILQILPKLHFISPPWSEVHFTYCFPSQLVVGSNPR